MPTLNPALLIAVSLVAIVLGYFCWRSIQLSRLAKLASLNIERRQYDLALLHYSKIDRLAARLLTKLSRDAYAFIAAHGQGVVLNLSDRPEDALGFLRRAQELLDQGVCQPAVVQCQIHCELARCYLAIERTHSADKLLAKAEKLCNSTQGDELASVLEHLRSQADGASARSHFPMAKRLSAFVLKKIESNAVLDEQLAASNRISQSQVHVMLGEYGPARELLSFAMNEDSMVRLSPQARDGAWLTLGNLEMIEGNLLSAIAYQQKLLDHKRQQLAPVWDLANAEVSLANAFRLYGDYRQAWEQSRQAISSISMLPPDDSVKLAVSCHASIHMLDAGEYLEANRLLSSIESSSHDSVRKNSGVLTVACLIRSLYYRDLMRFDDAFRSGREAQTLAEKIYGVDNHLTNEVRMILASTTLKLGGIAEAAAILNRVANAFAAKLDLNFFSRVDLLQAKSELLLAQGNVDEAERHIQECLELLKPRVLPSSFELASMHCLLGQVHLARGAYRLAIDQFTIAQQIRLMSMPETHPRLVPLYEDWANALEQLGQTDEALQQRLKANANREKWKDCL